MRLARILAATPILLLALGLAYTMLACLTASQWLEAKARQIGGIPR